MRPWHSLEEEARTACRGQLPPHYNSAQIVLAEIIISLEAYLAPTPHRPEYEDNNVRPRTPDDEDQGYEQVTPYIPYNGPR